MPVSAVSHNRSPNAPHPDEAQREIVVHAKLTIRDFRRPEPTLTDIEKYLGIFVEIETGESEWWLTDVAVDRFQTIRPPRPL